MIFHDLQIGAWEYSPERAQVIVLSSPVGRMRRPLTVHCNFAHFDEAAAFFPQSEWFSSAGLSGRLRRLGQELAGVLLPDPILAVVKDSLKAIPAGNGLRLRLCFDERMADWPWEFATWPDAADAPDEAAFIALSERVSLVREAPAFLHAAGSTAPEGEIERIVFAGTFWQTNSARDDHWGVQGEYIQLQQSLVHVQHFASVEFCESTEIEVALNWPAGILYYSGHVDPGEQGAHLVTLVADGQTPEPLPVQRLAELMAKAQTKLAFFSACNSAQHEFADPLLKAGLPALIGSLGMVSNYSSPVFGSILFSSLVVGLSIDEAAAAGRRAVQQSRWGSDPNYEWGGFVAYLPTSRVVLFPRAGSNAIQEHQYAERLTSALATHFDLDDLSNLCFTLQSSRAEFADLEYENLAGQTRLVKARELVQWCRRRSLLSQLGQRIRQERPLLELGEMGG